MLRLTLVCLWVGIALGISANDKELLLSIVETLCGPNCTSPCLANWNEATELCRFRGVKCHKGSQHVQSLELLSCGLIGVLPENLTELAELRQLILKNNSLTGPLPASWNQFHKVRLIELPKNKLTGSLPLSWANSTIRALKLNF